MYRGSTVCYRTCIHVGVDRQHSLLYNRNVQRQYNAIEQICPIPFHSRFIGCFQININFPRMKFLGKIAISCALFRRHIKDKKRIAYSLMMTRNIVEVDGKALRCYSVSRQHMALDSIHCKKTLAVFPSPAGMSLTKLSLDGNNLIFPVQGEFGE
jgi:hypothetical protein